VNCEPVGVWNKVVVTFLRFSLFNIRAFISLRDMATNSLCKVGMWHCEESIFTNSEIHVSLEDLTEGNCTLDCDSV
jgi:hypothetical protein